MIKDIDRYFEQLESELQTCFTIASEARKNGGDPSLSPEILPARDLAERVENLIGIPGLAQRIRQLDETMSREEAALAIGLSFANEEFGSYESKVHVVEKAVRTAVAVLTEGVVAAPIEGIARVELGRNDDRTDYLQIFYSGPIRSAGGTAQALSVLVADYVRRAVGIGSYLPRDEEVERYVEEIPLYKTLVNLQYTPPEDEIRTIVKNCPICIDGEGTEQEEVSGYRNLERVKTNAVRGGMALVLAEGLAQKAPKVRKHASQLGLDGWDWLKDIVRVKVTDDAPERKERRPRATTKDAHSTAQIEPNWRYMQDIIAGRPVFSHPSREGGFRLRYGRARNTGFASAGINPATMVVLGEFLAPGTQLKMERPGKAAGMSPVDSIEGPTVRLYNGNVVRIDVYDEAVRHKQEIDEILDLGEILVNYGDFLSNSHPLVPSSYVHEWWIQDLERAAAQKEEQAPIVDEVTLTAGRALSLSRRFDVPLHPKFTYLWHDITLNEFAQLAEYVSQKGSVSMPGDASQDLRTPDAPLELSVPHEPQIKGILETLLIPHTVSSEALIVHDAAALIASLGLDESLNKGWFSLKSPRIKSTMDAVTLVSRLAVRKRAPTRIGGRMGRPEKSHAREMKPPPHVLFPIGSAGGRDRSLRRAAGSSKAAPEHASEIDVQYLGIIDVDVGVRRCPSCAQTTYQSRCECGAFTEPFTFCPTCARELREGTSCPKCHRQAVSHKIQSIDLRRTYQEALAHLDETARFDKFKGVLGLISKNKTPEPIEKGVLRAKHDIFVFKDGTCRYDLTDLPTTHFTPREISVRPQRLEALGYNVEGDDDTVELAPQDIILSNDCGEWLLKVSKFVDDLLVRYYKHAPYYNAQTKEDLIGALVIGLAPHTSAGVLGRVIGFTTASAGFAHPFFHASKRRNCDGDEDCVMLLLDGLLNFSLSYLPDRRGGKMDAPLVLTTRIDPTEIDAEAHNLDIEKRYPREFYEATLRFQDPKHVKIATVATRLGTDAQYTGFGFTLPTTSIALGPANSTYKVLESMMDKMETQLELARRTRAVDERDVAERVIKTHFLPDIIGNLRAFSRQKVRCVKCNYKVRRPPISGNCPKCGGKIVLTVHEGTVTKYMERSIRIAEEYGISRYTRQRLTLLEMSVTSLFESDATKQMGLADFM
ncbi:MAG: DNA polymerase II large subunit [Halobacteriota archaeon]